jgi:hypothetical protein
MIWMERENGGRETGDGGLKKVDGFVVGEVTAVSRYVVPFFLPTLLFWLWLWSLTWRERVQVGVEALNFSLLSCLDLALSGLVLVRGEQKR